MLLLICPNCGPRNVAEFRYGGETNARPAGGASDGGSLPPAVSDDAWADYLYMRANKAGMQTEWWYHRAGCGLWFLAERDTKTNEVARTYYWSAPSSGSSPS